MQISIQEYIKHVSVPKEVQDQEISVDTHGNVRNISCGPMSCKRDRGFDIVFLLHWNGSKCTTFLGQCGGADIIQQRFHQKSC